MRKYSITYHFWEQYHSVKKFSFSLLYLLIVGATIVRATGTDEGWEEDMERIDSVRWDTIQLPDSLNGSKLVMDAPWYGKKHPWRAAAEAVGINATILAFDYFILDADFAQVTQHTLRRNFRMTNWFWDSDVFYTNLLSHPYQGNLFFNAARSNGMTFWESIPYTIGGDLLWELAGECELPSINDAISTGIGGLAIGETTFRLSNLVYDDSRRGMNRFTREFFGAVISPLRGLNRVITGEAWKVRNDYYLYHDDNRFPVKMSLTWGDRYVSSDDDWTGNFHTPYLDLSIVYGDAFSEEPKPYDYFTAEAGIVVGNHQKFLNNVHVLGQLYGTEANPLDRVKMRFGIYQHFNYDYAEGLNGGKAPYQLSETASVGVGFMYRVPDICRIVTFEQSFFLNGMALGGVWSDYNDNVLGRTYNVGSGFTAKVITGLSIAERVSLRLDTRFFRMFNWRGYEDEHGQTNTMDNPFSCQGERTNTSVWLLRPELNIHIGRKWGVNASGAYYYRNSNYRYRDNVSAHTSELRLGVMYRL